MRSCFYEGWITHTRTEPVAHSFRYRLMMPYFDLDELPEALDASRLWAAERRAPASFRRVDHFGDPAQPLADSVRDLVETETGIRPKGPIGLLTHPRYFGYVLNPISFFYCWNRAGDDLDAVVAEVTNTPWGERHCYVLPDSFHGSDSLHAVAPKTLHVSPFMEMELDHAFRITPPREQLRVGIANRQAGRTVFAAQLTLTRRPMTARNFARALWRYPLLTGRVHLAIHWQALRLWLRGAPFIPHPARPREVTSS